MRTLEELKKELAEIKSDRKLFGNNANLRARTKNINRLIKALEA